jgi:hypothetical protein
MSQNDNSAVEQAKPSQETIPTNSNQNAEALDYNKQLKQDFLKIFALIDLAPLQQEYLKARWLDQVMWMEKRATTCRNRFIRLRLITVVGSVLVPILITLNPGDRDTQKVANKAAIVVSSAVAICAAVEEFFSYGRRWYSYRRSVEALKSEGWQFFQLSGTYRAYSSHKLAFEMFSGQVEEIVQRDVDLYIAQQSKKLEQQAEEQVKKLEEQRRKELDKESADAEATD